MADSGEPVLHFGHPYATPWPTQSLSQATGSTAYSINRMPEQHGQHRTGMQNYSEGGMLTHPAMGNSHHSHSNQSGDLDVAHVSKPIAKAVEATHAFHASIIPRYLTQVVTP